MRIVLDTYVGRRAHEGIAGQALAVIGKKAGDVLLDYTSVVEIIKVTPLSGSGVPRSGRSRCARAGRGGAEVDLIVSGDQDLLVIGQFEDIPIVIAREAGWAAGALSRRPPPEQIPCACSC